MVQYKKQTSNALHSITLYAVFHPLCMAAHIRTERNLRRALVGQRCMGAFERMLLYMSTHTQYIARYGVRNQTIRIIIIIMIIEHEITVRVQYTHAVPSP